MYIYVSVSTLSTQVIKSPGAVTTVKLIGSSEAQQRAKQLIEDVVQLIGEVVHIDRGVGSTYTRNHHT